MNQMELKQSLIQSLIRLYEKKAFSILAQFLQGETQILFYLSHHREDEINPSDISEGIHVSRPRITAALAGLREKGFVTMELSEADRRRIKVSMTAAGAAWLSEKQQQVDFYFDQLVAGLGEETTMTLNQIIDQSIRIISAEE